MLAWETPNAPAGAGSTTLLPVESDGGFGREISAPSGYLKMTTDGHGATTALFTGPPVAGADPDRLPPGLRWRRYDSAGQETAGGDLTSEQVVSGPAVAANARGDVLVVWLASAHGDRFLRASTQRAGATTFTTPVTLGSDPNQLGLIAADVSDDGRLLVAYESSLRGTAGQPKKERAPQLTAWTGTITGGLRGRRSLGRRAATTSLSARFDGRGRGYVLWQGPGDGHDRTTPRLASIAPDANRFGTAVDLDGGLTEYTEPILATDPAGGAAVTWSRDEPHAPAMVAVVDAAGRVTSRQQVGRGQATALATQNGVAAVAVDVNSTTAGVAVRERGAARFGALQRPTDEYNAEPFDLAVEADGRVRFVAEFTDRRDQPRLLTMMRSAR